MVNDFLIVFVLAAFLNGCTLAEWRWRDKVAVVTGASSGIGAEVSMQLANKGMKVVGLARREHRLQEIVEQITDGKFYPVKCDVQNEQDIINAFQWVENTLGGVDVLVNNAGVFFNSHLSTGNTSEWKAMLDTNILGTTISTREALKTMRKRGDNGNIININSLAGHDILHVNNVGIGMYTASKYGITAISESLTNELSDAGSNIKVTSLSPGVVNTEIMTNATKTPENKFSEAMNKVKSINSDDIAEAVIYILSTKTNVHISELTIKQMGPTVQC